MNELNAKTNQTHLGRNLRTRHSNVRPASGSSKHFSSFKLHCDSLERVMARSTEILGGLIRRSLFSLLKNEQTKSGTMSRTMSASREE